MKYQPQRWRADTLHKAPNSKPFNLGPRPATIQFKRHNTGVQNCLGLLVHEPLRLYPPAAYEGRSSKHMPRRIDTSVVQDSLFSPS